MKPRQQISRAGIELIKRFEGFRCKAARLADGRWMIGYGHTLTARQGAEVSPEDAEALLIYDMIDVVHAINERVFAPLTQNQFDALCSFVFNIGVDRFANSSVLRRLNQGAHLPAACAMEAWRRADVAGECIAVDALVRRRAVEKALFLTPSGAWTPAPTPAVRPMLDGDGAGGLSWAPAQLKVTVDGDAVRADVEPVPPPMTPTDEADLAGAAAAAVSAKLERLFSEEAAANDFVLTAPADDQDEAPRRAFGRREANGDGEVSPGLFERVEPGVPGATDWPAGLDAEASAKPAAAGFGQPAWVEGRAALRRQEDATLWGLGAAGVILFLLGLIWTFGGQAAGAGGGDLTVVGWLAGVLGVALASVAAYRVLRRLGGQDVQPKR